jgi:hypothetical protein
MKKTYSDGSIYEGEFKNGKLVSEKFKAHLTEYH